MRLIRRIATGILAAGLMQLPLVAQAQVRGKPPPRARPQPTAAKPVKRKLPRPAPNTARGIETAVLVLDASGSMREQIDGQSKLRLAQRAVGKLVGKWDARIPLGLTAYGHRGTGCSDVETLVPVSSPKVRGFMAKVNGLAAKGNTPLTEAIISAAEQLDYENNQATIILVSDGDETCAADPCEMAKILRKSAVDLTVHVVGFAVNGGDGKLRCLARHTGGRYQKVNDAAGLDAALASIGKDVQARKAKWRRTCGKSWGKNGRWHNGRWTRRSPADTHAVVWRERRRSWKGKIMAKPEPTARPPRVRKKIGKRSVDPEPAAKPGPRKKLPSGMKRP